MNDESLKDKYSLYLKNGQVAFNSNNFKGAFKPLLKAYKIADKLNDLIKKIICSRMLKKVCYELASDLYDECIDLDDNEAYTRIAFKLKKALNISNLGVEFENIGSFTNETDNKELNDKIREFIEDNKENIKDRRSDRFETVKEKVSDVISAVGQGIADFFDTVTYVPPVDITVSSDIDEFLKLDYEEINDMHDENKKDELFRQLRYIKEQYLEAEKTKSYQDEISELKPCYRRAKDNDFSNTREFLEKQIAYCYYKLGYELYTSAKDSFYYSHAWENAKTKFTEAKDYFDLASDWDESDSDYTNLYDNCIDYIEKCDDNIEDEHYDYLNDD